LSRNHICILYLLASCPYMFYSNIHQLMCRNIILVVLRNTSRRLRSWRFCSSFLNCWCSFTRIDAFSGSLHRKKLWKKLSSYSNTIMGAINIKMLFTQTVRVSNAFEVGISATLSSTVGVASLGSMLFVAVCI
jgi:hypothetical protein